MLGVSIAGSMPLYFSIQRQPIVMLHLHFAGIVHADFVDHVAAKAERERRGAIGKRRDQVGVIGSLHPQLRNRSPIVRG